MEDTPAALPDDMLLEILVRFKDDAAALFKCAMVCKRWRRLVADPYFLRRCWPEPPSLAGFFTNKMPDGHGQGPCLVPTPGSLLGGGHGIRALESFVPGAAAGLLNHAVPLACRHGLLLVHLAPHDADRAVVVVRLAVCNLLTGTCHVLPPLNPARKLQARSKAGYAILTGADCRTRSPSPSAFFKVVIVLSSDGLDGGHDLSLHMLSSSGGEEAGARWSTPPAGKRFDRVVDAVGPRDCYARFVQSDAVVGHGTAHWLFPDWGAPCLCTIQVDAETGHVSSKKLPRWPMNYIMGRPCLGVAAADGALSLLRLQRSTGPRRPRLQTWAMMQDDGDQTAAAPKYYWLKTAELRVLASEEEAIPDLIYVLAEKCGKLLVTDDRCHVYTADLGTGTTEEVADWPRGTRLIRDDVVPLEMDWSAMFVSRLGSARYRVNREHLN